MPIINKKELEASIGGYFYYDTLGNPLGLVGGEGNVVFVLPPGSNPYSMNQQELFSKRQSLSSQSDFTKKQIIRRIAEDAGYPGMLINFDNFSGASAGFGGYTDMKNGQITFNLSNPSMSYGNYWDLQFIVRHEWIHAQQYTDPECKNWSTRQLESAAYTWMVNQPEFSLCSASFQDRMRAMQHLHP